MIRIHVTTPTLAILCWFALSFGLSKALFASSIRLADSCITTCAAFIIACRLAGCVAEAATPWMALVRTFSALAVSRAAMPV